MKAGGCRSVCVQAELGEQGAARGAYRGDVVVIVDALRASATMVAALQAKATGIIAVRTVEEATAYLGDDRYRVAGERSGAKLLPLHYGNSPVEIWAHREEIAGRTLVLTTSNGTRCITAGIRGAAAVMVGSTVNASAAARAALAVAEAQGTGITLVAAGVDDQPAEEDTFSQALIGQALVGWGAIPFGWSPKVRPESSIRAFLDSGAARTLTELGYEQDIHLCARVDLWDSVPRYQDGRFVVHSDERRIESQPAEAPFSDHA